MGSKAQPTTGKVFIVDPHSLVRDGLRARITSRFGYFFTGEAAGVAEVPPACGADVLVVDMECAAEATDFPEFVASIAPASVVVVGWRAQAHEVRRIMAAGASGFVLKDAPAEELLAAIEAALSGGRSLSSGTPLGWSADAFADPLCRGASVRCFASWGRACPARPSPSS